MILDTVSSFISFLNNNINWQSFLSNLKSILFLLLCKLPWFFLSVIAISHKAWKLVTVFVCLFVWGFSSHTRYGQVSINGVLLQGFFLPIPGTYDHGSVRARSSAKRTPNLRVKCSNQFPTAAVDRFEVAQMVQRLINNSVRWYNVSEAA